MIELSGVGIVEFGRDKISSLAKTLFWWWLLSEVAQLSYQLVPAEKKSQLPITFATINRVPERGFERQFAILLLTCFPEASLYHEVERVIWFSDKDQKPKIWKGTLIDFKLVFPNDLTIYIEVGRSTARRSHRKQEQLKAAQAAGIGERYCQLGHDDHQKICTALKNNGSQPTWVTFWEVVFAETGFDINPLLTEDTDLMSTSD